MTASPSLHGAGTQRLLDYFRAVGIDDGIATVRFDNGALAYLNSTACAQATVKAPITQTLMLFPDVHAVAWEVDGIVITDWDA